MIQWVLATWSLVPLLFLKPAWTSGSSRFMYCWSLAWRILSITLLACEMSAIVQYFEHSLILPFFGVGMKIDLFQSCSHYWVFQMCWHIECSPFTASSFRIWNSSTGIPSLPLALFIGSRVSPFSGNAGTQETGRDGELEINKAVSSNTPCTFYTSWFCFLSCFFLYLSLQVKISQCLMFMSAQLKGCIFPIQKNTPTVFCYSVQLLRGDYLTADSEEDHEIYAEQLEPQTWGLETVGFYWIKNVKGHCKLGR